MTKLKHVINKPSTVDDCSFGIEFEVEAQSKLPKIATGTWGTHTDASLRGGTNMEYVTQKPLPLIGAQKAVSRLLSNLLDETKADVIKDSKQTSWHVHVNAVEKTATQYFTNVLTYWMFEPMLITMCGPSRKQNTFCLQIKDTEYVADKLYDAIKFMRTDPRQLSYSLRGFNRYSGQNLHATYKLGSVEYRSMCGTFDNDTIQDWILVLNCIWSNNPFHTPKELLDYYYDHGVSNTFKYVFDGTRLVNTRSIYSQSNIDQVDDNAELVAYIASSDPNWNDLEDYIKTYFERLSKQTFRKSASPNYVLDITSIGLN